ncbi:hypothetical protein ABZ815_35245 [Nonomuraea sp. NPDC047529]|uniref:hypothetical protein n=1 Tax=Nonomuraea sp. NPDC047529 TaxID=3155623 RepID=UPI0033DE650D
MTTAPVRDGPVEDGRPARGPVTSTPVRKCQEAAVSVNGVPVASVRWSPEAR